MLWGIFSEHPLLGFFAALLLECHRWFRWHLSFSDQDYIRVWNVCVVLFLIVAVFQVMGREVGRWQITRSFQLWMPMLLYPMIWAQMFTRGPDPPLLTFSLVARRKRAHDERTGRSVAPVKRAHIGYFYFAVLLLSLGMAGRDLPNLGAMLGLSLKSPFVSVSVAYVAVCGLLLWALLGFISKTRWIQALILFLLAAFLGHHLQLGIRQAHLYVQRKTMDWFLGDPYANARSAKTKLGEVGEVKLSPKIYWRLTPVQGKRPVLLPEATYDFFQTNRWAARRHERSQTIEPVEEGQGQWEIHSIETAEALSEARIRGRASDQVTAMPRMEDTAMIFDFPASGLKKHPLGSLVAQPRYSAINYTVYTSDEVPAGILESIPHAKTDFQTPSNDHDALTDVINQLDLSEEAPTRDKIRLLEQFFQDPANGFRYTRYLRGTGDADVGRSTSAIARFLSEEGRAGHCEYYASATVLLLRKMKVPARYVVGYAVKERDEATGEFVLRGTHRHAWARAWLKDEKRWIDVDTTPANWLEFEKQDHSAFQRFLDRWDRWMLSWNLWRRDDDKGLVWTLLPLLLAGALLIVVVLRLIRGLRKGRSANQQTEPDQQALQRLGLDSAWYQLEEALTQRFYKRRHQQTVASWCGEISRIEPPLKGTLMAILDAHYQYRFDPNGLSESHRNQLKTRVLSLCDQLNPEAAS